MSQSKLYLLIKRAKPFKWSNPTHITRLINKFFNYILSMKLPLPFYTKILAQEFSIIEYQNELNYQSHIFTTKDETGDFLFLFFFLDYALIFYFFIFF
jgi:hypothetical protein